MEINGACHPSIALCTQYNPDASCNTCQAGTLLIQGYCIPSAIANLNTTSSPSPTTNLVCQSRQYISNGQCVTMGPACLSFLINGTCTECDQGYTLFQGLCVQDPVNNQVVISYIPSLQPQANTNSSYIPSLQPQTNTTETTNNYNQTSLTPPATSPSVSACNPPCATCSQDPSYCLTCTVGFATVDSIPGQCFKY